MALAAVLFSLGACREGWVPLGSKCVWKTTGSRMNSACASDCASVMRPWLANDTAGVQMCIDSQDEYDFLHSWVIGPYWTGFQRQSSNPSPADWRTAVVHAQGSACSAGANPWFDSLMSHQRASPLLSNTAPRALRLTSACVGAQPLWKIIRSGA